MTDNKKPADLRAFCYHSEMSQYTSAKNASTQDLTPALPDPRPPYSDSANDIPLLEVVSDPVAVAPGIALRLRAETLGWPIISLREKDADGAGSGIILQA